MRRFEIVAEPYKILKEEDLVVLPYRSTAKSAGYDFTLPYDLNLKPQEQHLVWTDIKVLMPDDDYLKIVPRSGLSTKHGIILANIEGIIDSDYYNNETTGGNIGLCLLNISNNTVFLEKGTRIAQGIFSKYYTTCDDMCLEERKGGLGSSGR